MLIAAASGPNAPNVIAIVLFGTLEGAATWLLFTWLGGGEVTWDGFVDALLDSFVISSAIAVIIAVGSYINYVCRIGPVSEAELTECATQCFIAGTLVQCEDGLKKIEDVQIGDKVLAYNEETGEQAYKPVLHLFRNESKDWTGITVEDKEIVSTPGHKYYLPQTKQWVSAKDLKVGDTVLLSNGQLSKVQATCSIHYATAQTTYNFEVADFHTYYVESGILVHNQNCAFDNFYNDPKSLWGKTEEEVGKALGDGWNRKPYATNKTGWEFYKGDKRIAYHPGGGRHGANYYKISRGVGGKIKVVGQGYKLGIGEKAKIVYMFGE